LEGIGFEFFVGDVTIGAGLVFFGYVIGPWTPKSRDEFCLL